MDIQVVSHVFSIINSATMSTWASLVAQLVKNSPAVQDTPVQFLGRVDLLEKGKATHSSILARRIPWTVEPMGSRGHKASDMTE